MNRVIVCMSYVACLCCRMCVCVFVAVPCLIVFETRHKPTDLCGDNICPDLCSRDSHFESWSAGVLLWCFSWITSLSGHAAMPAFPDWAMTASVEILSSSSFTSRPTIDTTVSGTDSIIKRTRRVVIGCSMNATVRNKLPPISRY